MHLYGLIGRKLQHSFSPDYFNEKFRQENISAKYVLFEIDQIAKVRQIILNNKNLTGLNVTIPYKRDIMNFLDWIDPAAKEVGSVNTVKIERVNEKVRLLGFNTDVIGFRQSLESVLKGKKINHALVLGSGGSSGAVTWVLDKMNIDWLMVSRRPKSEKQVAYERLNRQMMEENLLLVNTTPLGMFPDTGSYPHIPYPYLTESHVLFDLVYNPPETAFLQKGKLQGALTINGLEMLKIQAEEAWRVWQGTS
jgi:shikimate dehydrogenase